MLLSFPDPWSHVYSKPNWLLFRVVSGLKFFSCIFSKTKETLACIALIDFVCCHTNMSNQLFSKNDLVYTAIPHIVFWTTEDLTQSRAKGRWLSWRDLSASGDRRYSSQTRQANHFINHAAFSHNHMLISRIVYLGHFWFKMTADLIVISWEKQRLNILPPFIWAGRGPSVFLWMVIRFWQDGL